METNITVRNAKLSDAPRILDIYTYYVENTVITFEYDVPSLEEFENRMIDIMKKYPYLVIERDGRIEGYAYAHAFVGRAAYDWASELTIYLDHNAKKCGLGRKLYEALAERLKDMGVLNLYACIGYPKVEDEYLNKNSAQFHEHLGFRLCGTFENCGYKFNRWYDMIWMEKIIGEHRSDQAADFTSIPDKTSVSGIFGVRTAAIGNRYSFNVPMASSLISFDPLVATMTGSTTIFSALCS